MAESFLFPTCKGLYCSLTPAQVGRVFCFRLAGLCFENEHHFNAGETFSLIFGMAHSRLGLILIEYYFYSYGSEMTIAVFVFLLKNYAP